MISVIVNKTVYDVFHDNQNHKPGNTKGGKYHCTVDLLFDWFGFVCFANKNKNI